MSNWQILQSNLREGVTLSLILMQGNGICMKPVGSIFLQLFHGLEDVSLYSNILTQCYLVYGIDGSYVLEFHPK